MHYSQDAPLRIIIKRGNLKLGFLAAPVEKEKEDIEVEYTV